MPLLQRGTDNGHLVQFYLLRTLTYETHTFRRKVIYSYNFGAVISTESEDELICILSGKKCRWPRVERTAIYIPVVQYVTSFDIFWIII
jgi:hypothetical protein